MHRHQYFKHGRAISAAEALDERGLLRDGCTLRVPAMFRDSAQSNSGTRVTDAANGADPTAGSRPGWRVMSNSVNDAREAAHREYLDYIRNAYKEPTACA